MPSSPSRPRSRVSDATRAVGETMIARELDNIPNEKVRNITREYRCQDRAGRARLPLLKKGRGAAGIPRPIIKGGFPMADLSATPVRRARTHRLFRAAQRRQVQPRQRPNRAERGHRLARCGHHHRPGAQVHGAFAPRTGGDDRHPRPRRQRARSARCASGAPCAELNRADIAVLVVDAGHGHGGRGPHAAQTL